MLGPLGDPGALAGARLHLLFRQFCSLFSETPTGKGLLEQPGLGDSLLSPVVTLSAPKKAMGRLLSYPVL